MFTKISFLLLGCSLLAFATCGAVALTEIDDRSTGKALSDDGDRPAGVRGRSSVSADAFRELMEEPQRKMIEACEDGQCFIGATGSVLGTW
jgi:hypothetical protein